jgi:hypothetical protein
MREGHSIIRLVKNQQQENSERTGLPLGTEGHVRQDPTVCKRHEPVGAVRGKPTEKSKHALVIVDTSRLAEEAIADAAAIAMEGSRPGRGRV